MNLLEPWIFARLAAGVAATALFVHGAWVSAKVLRFFHLGKTGEGQLALERQAELSAASARVGTALQGAALLLSITAADRLSGHLRGAMCGYGVVHATEAGPHAMASSAVASLLSLALLRLLSLDRGVRSLGLVRPLAAFTLVVAVASGVDLLSTALWLGGLDFSVVASCCSSGLDAGESATLFGHGASGRALVGLLAPALALAAAAASWLGARRPTRPRMRLAGALSLAALPLAFAAAALIVAPHAYEVPHHRCPYCLFRVDAWWLGYPLLAALLLAASSALASALAAQVTPPGEQAALESFASPQLAAASKAWLIALALAAGPVLRYLLLSGGRLL